MLRSVLSKARSALASRPAAALKATAAAKPSRSSHWPRSLRTTSPLAASAFPSDKPFSLACTPGSQRAMSGPAPPAAGSGAGGPGFATVGAKEGGELVSSGACTYLDVRTAQEFEGGHCPGAVNVPVMVSAAGGMAPNPDFLAQVQAAIPDKGAQLVVGCKAGMRSEKASKMMAEAGYTGLKNMTGGFDAWAGAGLPVSK